eukprot:gb/GEZN01002140.1/.p1 GENE.gb/GEZN01002140.1/~~gb/GEZN01002140.1/.p1  ORF type:complete len:199 (+),score=19.94 gb/GEZN01002140.1/:1299-1895(+)
MPRGSFRDVGAVGFLRSVSESLVRGISLRKLSSSSKHTQKSWEEHYSTELPTAHVVTRQSSDRKGSTTSSSVASAFSPDISPDRSARSSFSSLPLYVEASPQLKGTSSHPRYRRLGQSQDLQGMSETSVCLNRELLPAFNKAFPVESSLLDDFSFPCVDFYEEEDGIMRPAPSLLDEPKSNACDAMILPPLEEAGSEA